MQTSSVPTAPVHRNRRGSPEYEEIELIHRLELHYREITQREHSQIMSSISQFFEERQCEIGSLVVVDLIIDSCEHPLTTCVYTKNSATRFYLRKMVDSITGLALR